MGQVRRSVIVCVAAVLMVTAWAVSSHAQSRTARVVSEQAALREQGATTGRVIRTLPKGETLEVLEASGTWLRVRVASDGAVGFVHSLLVETSGAAAVSGGVTATPAPSAVPASMPLVVPPGQTQGTSARSVAFKVHAGLLVGDMSLPFVAEESFTGIQGGAGVLFRPFDNERIEASLSASYGRGTLAQVEYEDFKYEFRVTTLVAEGHLWYHFDTGGDLSPFVGGGIALGRYRLIERAEYSDYFGSVTDRSQFTNTKASLIASGGLQFSERFRLEATAGTTFSVLGAVRF